MRKTHWLRLGRSDQRRRKDGEKKEKENHWMRIPRMIYQQGRWIMDNSARGRICQRVLWSTSRKRRKDRLAKPVKYGSSWTRVLAPRHWSLYCINKGLEDLGWVGSELVLSSFVFVGYGCVVILSDCCCVREKCCVWKNSRIVRSLAGCEDQPCNWVHREGRYIEERKREIGISSLLIYLSSHVIWSLILFLLKSS